MSATIGIGLIGHSFMGAVHSQAWRSVHRFFDGELEPQMAVLAGRDPGRAKDAAARFGWAESTADWRDLLRRTDIDLVDVCTPGDSHAEIAIAALAAGKHVLCEKPLANSVAEAERMVQAAGAAAGRGVRAMVGFNYRRVPAVALAARLVADGRLGRLHHVRALYLQDWIADPAAPLVWRLQAERAGSGALGDIGAHIVDAAQFVTGQRIASVSGLTETFVRERPLVDDLGDGRLGRVGPGGGDDRRGPVTVDDCALFTARLDGGAVATFEATRFATGRKNAMRLEVNGSAGSLSFDFEAMNELWFHDHTLPEEEAGYRRILVTEPGHPYAGAWWPPGHGLGYEHAFTHQAHDLLTAIADGTDPAPSFADGLQVQRVLDAVVRSAADESRMTPVEETP